MKKRIKSSDNGAGTDILAQAMRRVFKEAVEEGVAPLTDLVGDVEKNMATKKDIEAVSDRIDTTNENMRTQFEEQPRLISQEVHKVLERKSGK